MGFNGDIVVLRGPKPLAELTPFVGTSGHPVEDELAGVDGWRFVYVRHFDHPYSYDLGMLEELFAATGEPVMVCNVFESDVAYIQGLSSAGYWEGWLDPGSAAVYQAGRMLDDAARESGAQVFDANGNFVNPELYASLIQECADTMTRERPEVARAVVDWAADAGRTVALEAVAEHLGLTREPFAEQLFLDLLDVIGVGEGQ